MTPTSTASPPSVEVVGMSKRFGALQALDDVSLALPPGSFHALLGENGAGKSTLAKCLMGYCHADSGRLVVDGEQSRVTNPRDAHALGLGMVYQHFSLVPHMTVAENLVIARAANPFIFNWAEERRRLDEFLATMPFTAELSAPASSLAAGEKQKVEVLKQLYLDHRVLILDEPTSVLTPGEATELFDHLRTMTEAKKLSVLLITHKFREVFEFTAQVTVLRRGEVAARGETSSFTPARLAETMVGSERLVEPVARGDAPGGEPKLSIEHLGADNDKGFPAVRDVGLDVHAGEIVGVAGVSGNGQRELIEVLAGQRRTTGGVVRLHGEPYSATRPEIARHGVYCLPEEPLQNACARTMSVAENLAIRDFDVAPQANFGWLLSRSAVRRKARELIDRYGITTSSPDAQITQLSGGNVQRTVLARELSQQVEVLIAANPCSGLDVGAVSEIHAQLMAARNRGAAVLLVSEDLDELMALADRIVVMFEGELVYETPASEANLATIGGHMAGHRDKRTRTATASLGLEATSAEPV